MQKTFSEHFTRDNWRICNSFGKFNINFANLFYLSEISIMDAVTFGVTYRCMYSAICTTTEGMMALG